MKRLSATARQRVFDLETKRRRITASLDAFSRTSCDLQVRHAELAEAVMCLRDKSRILRGQLASLDELIADVRAGKR